MSQMRGSPVVRWHAWGVTTMKRRVFVSLIAFFLFSLVGPLIRLVFPPTANSERFARIVDSVVLYIWPTTLLGVGREITWQTTVDLVVANILFFVLFGLLIGLLARRAWVAAVLYVLTCAAVFSIEAWGFKANIGFRTWSALAIIFLLYAIPFWAVRHVAGSTDDKF
jgi:hypothetical protein